MIYSNSSIIYYHSCHAFSTLRQVSKLVLNSHQQEHVSWLHRTSRNIHIFPNTAQKYFPQHSTEIFSPTHHRNIFLRHNTEIFFPDTTQKYFSWNNTEIFSPTTQHRNIFHNTTQKYFPQHNTEIFSPTQHRNIFPNKTQKYFLQHNTGIFSMTQDRWSGKYICTSATVLRLQICHPWGGANSTPNPKNIHLDKSPLYAPVQQF